MASSVGVSWPAAGNSATPTRPCPGLWSQHGDAVDRALPDHLVEPPLQVRGEHPQLGRPGGGVGPDHQVTIDATLRLGVCGHVGADDTVPPRHSRVYGDLLPPAVLAHQPVHRSRQRLWIAVVGLWTAPTSPGCGSATPDLSAAIPARSAGLAPRGTPPQASRAGCLRSPMTRARPGEHGAGKIVTLGVPALTGHAGLIRLVRLHPAHRLLLAHRIRRSSPA